ncbi:hypothetical protein EL17_19975 [Anditalea andensis]|uniref:Uncharacterized protein n=1 Tax=Anditalea andensis TaxID=1048983 RepID=A0A074KVD4_9BACT|nr:hypothetical protein EL17_19975 [Anditalea andensis]
MYVTIQYKQKENTSGEKHYNFKKDSCLTINLCCYHIDIRLEYTSISPIFEVRPKAIDILIQKSIK